MACGEMYCLDIMALEISVSFSKCLYKWVHGQNDQVHAVLATSTKAYIQILTAVRFFPEQEFSRGEKCMCA